MNPRLLTCQEKAENRKARDRRKRLKKLVKKRALMLSQIENQQEFLALIESNVITAGAIFELWFGRLKQARKVMRQIHLVAAAAKDESVLLDGLSFASDSSTPHRVLQGPRRGLPKNEEEFWFLYGVGTRMGNTFRRLSPISRGPNALAYFDTKTFHQLLPGIRIPKGMFRDAFFTRWIDPIGFTPAVVEVFSITGRGLFSHPMPAGFGRLRQDREKNSSTGAGSAA